jgi:hypothetical protein
MDTEEILNQFKKLHPKLVKLNPKIWVDEIYETSTSCKENSEWEVKTYDPPLIKITVFHDFIFDNRLVPETFNGLEVLNVTQDDTYPKGHFEISKDYPSLEFESPKKYELFVDNNIELIREKLKSKNLSKKEALDALTGEFEKFVEERKGLR